jgi:PadR family transcriptional regulator PadR
MPKGDYLGEFEQLILAAVLLLGENAYGVTIHEKVEQLAKGRSVALGSVYVTLDRLQQKGYFTSWFSDPTPGRGGRAKRFFKITACGATALNESIRVSANLVENFRKIKNIGELA